MKDASCKAKMKNNYTGPYQITSISSSNCLYYLKDIYNHQLKRPIPANQLVHYYGVGGFCRQNNYVENCEADSLDDIGYAPDSQSIPYDIGAAASDSESVRDFGSTGSDSQGIPDDIETAASDSEIVKHGMDVSDDDSIQYSETDSNINDDNCQRARICIKHNEEMLKPKNLVPPKILIMQSNDTSFSSDEYVLDVCIDDNVQENHKMYNPWGKMNWTSILIPIATQATILPF